MTDNEMIKYLRTKGLGNGASLGSHSGKIDLIADRLLELLAENNRQQAEIERLTEENKIIDLNRKMALLEKEPLYHKLKTAKSEAIREFVDEIQKEINILLKEYYERKKEREFELEQASYSLIIDRTLQYYRGKIEVLDAINLLINTKLKEMAGDKL